MKTHHDWTRIGLIAASLLLTVPAGAQSPELSALPTAQALFEAATKAMDAGDYATACPKLEEVVRLVPEGLGAKLTLARCYEGAGKLASAWTLYSVIESSARDNERIKHAGQQATALRPKLAELTIQVPEQLRALPGLEVEREGIAVRPAQWGVPIPIDKGVYVVSARATGKRPWTHTVRVQTDGVKIDVMVGPMQDALTNDTTATTTQKPASTPAQIAQDSKSKPPNVTEPTQTSTSNSSPMRTVGFMAGGLGLAGLALGAVTGGLAMSHKQTVDEHCDSSGACDRQGLDAADTGQMLGWISTIGFGVGLAGLATGGVLLLAAPSKADQTAGAHQVTAQASPHGGLVLNWKGVW